MRAACPAPPAACLFRITEGFNVETARRHGTDRFGRDRAMDWRGHRGPPRAFVDVVFASTAAEIEAALASGAGGTALHKVPITPDPHWLVYRMADLERVHDRQYAFRDPARRRAALLAVLRVASMGSTGGFGDDAR